MKSIILFVLVGFLSFAQARPLTFAEKLSDLDQLISSIKSGYGPLRYKKDNLGIDVDELRKQYLPLVEATKTNGEFYYLIRRFISEFKDSHFGALVPTDKFYFVPFFTDLVDGKVLIDQINRQLLPESNFSFKRGDEIVEMNGRPVMEEVEKLMPYNGSGYEPTARRFSTMTLTMRSGQNFPPVRGNVSFTIRQAATGQLKTVNLKWLEQGEGIDENFVLRGPPSLRKPVDYRMLSIANIWRTSFGPNLEVMFMCSGGTRTKVPDNAIVIRREPFVAYYHPTSKGNIGYLRIPHYDPVNEETGEEEAEERFQQYEAAVKVLEENTVGLIIDQDHNCGGRADYLQALIGLFVSTPFKGIEFSLLANKGEYMQNREVLSVLDPNSAQYTAMKKLVDLIKAHWFNGDFMTAKTTYDGIMTNEPNPIHYTKPIVILIDEMSGSGGDAFPAQMQGYGRAKLLGTRTMGAGGHVADQPELNYSRISYGMTKSLFFRPDGTPVENNGAHPDIPYSISKEDFVSGYVPYQKFYLEKLMEMIP